MFDAVIVGAGMTGLCAAIHLEQAGQTVCLVEKGGVAGGRLQTTFEEGFQLDHGFQVLLTAYPEARLMLDYAALGLRAFQPGALVRFQGRFHVVSDPFRDPWGGMQTAFGPIGSLRDKLLVARLRAEVERGRWEDAFSAPETTIEQYLQDFGFSPNLIDRFFRPFFGGILLDRALQPSSRMFRFVFRMLAEGDTALPAGGIAAIPAQLASRLRMGTLRLHSPVVQVDGSGVVIECGERIEAQRVIVATEAAAALTLTSARIDSGQRSVSSVYFAAPSPPIAKPWLILNGDGEGPINNLTFPSLVAPSYAPSGRTLVCASVLGTNVDLDAVRRQLDDWFGQQTSQWRHLATYEIAYAQPAALGDDPLGGVRQLDNGVILCGDYCATPSLQGAMRSGRNAASLVMESPAAGPC